MCVKRIFCSLVFILSVSVASSQNDSAVIGRDPRRPHEKEKSSMRLRDRLYWGGTVGAWFGTQTFVDLSPIIGFKVNEKLSVGVGAIYNYYSYKYLGAKYQTSLYGSRLFARYFIIENIFAQVGWDHINRDNPYSYNLLDQRVWVDNLLVGGGVRYPINNSLYCVATGLWNLNQSPLSPYANPIIQIGFVGGF